MENDHPQIRGGQVRPLMAPLPIPHKTASGTLEVAPLVLVDVECSDGTVGSTYLFAYTPVALTPLADMTRSIIDGLVGEPADPSHVHSLLEARFRLLGNQGLVAMAQSGVDMALWDATAKRKDQPLCALLGSAPGPVRIYDSLGQMPADETAHEVEQSLERGFRAFKIKAGHPEPELDRAAIRAVRDVAGSDTWLAIDFNQAFSPSEAIRRMQMLDEEALAWIEEPVLASDLDGHAAVRAAIRTPVQTGENWWGVADMKKALAAGACDLTMPDAVKIGGVTGWVAAARIAESARMPVASHLFGETSAHLLAATPTAMILEWFDIAGSITINPPNIADGYITPSPAPGSGVTWDEAAISRLG